MPTPTAPADQTRYLRITDIMERFPISRATIYRLAKKDQFPKPVRMGSSSLWIEGEVLAWEPSLLAALIIQVNSSFGTWS